MRISDWSSDVCSSDLENGNFFIINQTTGEPGSPWAYAPPGFGNLLLGKNGIETKADSAYFKVAKDYTPTSPWSFKATYTYTKEVENRFFGENFAFDFPDFGVGDCYPDRQYVGWGRRVAVSLGSW